MKKIVGIVIVVMASLSGMTQQVYNIIIDDSIYDFSVQSMLENPDKGVVIAGLASGSGINGFDFFITKLDPSGNLLWRTIYPTPDAEFNATMVKAWDSGYVLAGTTYSFPINDADTIKDYMVVKFDESGKFEWKKVYPGYDCYTLSKSPDSRYVLVGNVLNPQAERFKNFSDILVYKIDVNGDSIWSNKIGVEGFDVVNRGSIYFDEQANILVTSESDSGATNYLSGLLYKLSPSGTVLNKKYYQDHPTENLSQHPEYFIELDQQEHYYIRGNTVYNVDYVKLEETKIKELNSVGAIAGEGNNVPYISRHDHLSKNRIAYGRLDHTFNVQWEKELSVAGQSWSRLYPVQTVAALDGGNYFLFHEKDSTDKDYGRLLKTDCYGNTETWKDCSLEVEVPEELQIVVYPNPNNGKLLVKHAVGWSYKLYDVDGRETLNGTVRSNEELLQFEESAEGVYLLVLQNNDHYRMFKLMKQ